jgi:hypothetical protein
MASVARRREESTLLKRKVEGVYFGEDGILGGDRLIGVYHSVVLN